MSNPWFRMYSEFAHDPKVQMMNEAMQRRYIMLMCMRCGNVLVTLHETEIAFHLRISNEELAETKALFISKGFIDNAWSLLNWEKRQFVSDRSAPRVAKHRALQKAKQETNGNVDVTLQKQKSNALDTDTDTDTDKKEDKAQAPFVLPDWIPVEAWAGYVEMRKKQRKQMTARARGLVVKELEKLRASGNDVGAVLDASTKNAWVDVYAEKKPDASAAKAGSDEYMQANKHAAWVKAAGFETIWDAANARCFSHNAHQFRDGHRIEVAA